MIDCDLDHLVDRHRVAAVGDPVELAEVVGFHRARDRDRQDVHRRDVDHVARVRREVRRLAAAHPGSRAAARSAGGCWRRCASLPPGWWGGRSCAGMPLSASSRSASSFDRYVRPDHVVRPELAQRATLDRVHERRAHLVDGRLSRPRQLDDLASPADVDRLVALQRLAPLGERAGVHDDVYRLGERVPARLGQPEARLRQIALNDLGDLGRVQVVVDEPDHTMAGKLIGYGAANDAGCSGEENCATLPVVMAPPT